MSLEAARNVVVSHSSSESTPVWLANCLYDIRLDTTRTEGRMSLTIISSEADNVIAPPHQHLDADELIYVLDGLLLVKVYHGDVEEGEAELFEDLGRKLDPEAFESHTLFTGDFIWMPSGTIEALFTTDRSMRAIFVFAPAGGSDEFFINAGVPARSIRPPSIQEYERPGIDILRKLSTEAEFQYIPPSGEADG